MIFALIDFETTGLTRHPQAPIQQQPEAIEFGCLLYDSQSEEIVDTCDVLINPTRPLEKIITDITGLTDEILASEPPFGDRCNIIGTHLSRADAVIAHNLSFDRAIMAYELARMGLSLKDVHWPKIEICTVEQTFPKFGRRMKLSELYEHYVGPYEQKHRALDDIMLMHAICQKIGLYQCFLN
jgi:DNA polymerase III alpha subunit (gram-positive type)